MILEVWCCVDYEAICNLVMTRPKTNFKRDSYKEYTDKERLLTAQHASLYGIDFAVRKWKKCFSKLN